MHTHSAIGFALHRTRSRFTGDDFQKCRTPGDRCVYDLPIAPRTRVAPCRSGGARLCVEVARDRFGAEIDARGWLVRAMRGSCASDLVKVKV